MANQKIVRLNSFNKWVSKPTKQLFQPHLRDIYEGKKCLVQGIAKTKANSIVRKHNLMFAQLLATDLDLNSVLGRFCKHHQSPGSVRWGCPECDRKDPVHPAVGM